LAVSCALHSDPASMNLHLWLDGGVRIKNTRLALLHHACVLVVIAFCIWTFIAERRGTLEIANSPLVSIASRAGASRHYAVSHNQSTDRQCQQPPTIQREEEEAHGTRFGCTRLSSEECDFCVPTLLSIFTPHSPFDMEIDIADKGLGRGAVMERYHAFTQAVRFNFSYSYMLSTGENTFFGIPKSLRSGTNKQARTVLLDRDGAPTKTFEAGETISVTAAQLLYVAKGAADIIMTPDTIQKLRFGPYDGSAEAFPAWTWVTGATLRIMAECYSDDFDLKAAGRRIATREHTSALWSLGASKTEPVCLLRVALAKDSSLKLHSSSGLGPKGAVIMTLHLVSNAGTSFFRVWNIESIILFITSSMVLLSIPKAMITFLTLNCFGHLSQIYKNVTIGAFDIQQHCAKALMHLVVQSICFERLADIKFDGGEADMISRTCFLQRLHSIFREWEALDGDEVQMMADFTLAKILEGTRSSRRVSTASELFEFRGVLGGGSGSGDSRDDFKGVNFDNFCYAVSGDALHVKSLVKLFDRDRRLSIGERMFMPSQLRKHVSHHRSDDADKGVDVAVNKAGPHSESGSEPEPAPRSESEDVFGCVRAEVVRLDRALKELQSQLQHDREQRAAAAEAALAEQLSRVNRLETVVNFLAETRHLEQRLDTTSREALQKLQRSTLMQQELTEMRSTFAEAAGKAIALDANTSCTATYDIDNVATCDENDVQPQHQTVIMEPNVDFISLRRDSAFASGGSACSDIPNKAYTPRLPQKARWRKRGNLPGNSLTALSPRTIR